MGRWFMAVGGLVLALWFGGCGGGEGNEAEVEATLRTVALSHDPAKCTQVETPNLIEQNTGYPGKQGLRECEKGAAEPTGHIESVAVRAVEIDGDSATAEISPRGGALDGQTVEVGLVEEEGSWKLDELIRFVRLDRPALATAIVKVDTEQDEASVARVRCFARLVPKQSREDVEAIVLSKQQAAAIVLAEKCPELEPDGPAAVQVAKSIDRFVRSSEATKCFEEATQGYLEQVYGGKGSQALARCAELTERAKGQAKPTTVVFNIQSDGERAIAYLELQGIGLDQQVLKIALLRRYGHWVLDRRLALVHADRAGFAREALAALEGAGLDPTPALTACIRDSIIGKTRAEFEALIFDTTQQRSKRIGERCLAGAKAPPAPS